MKKLIQIVLISATVGLFTSCQDKDSPNYQYMPDMYEEVSYEAYGSYDVFPNGMEAMVPAEGSVSRGWMPYDYEDNREGYESAKADLKNPIPLTEDNVNEGKALYTTYCAVCHGDEGNGKGILAQREKILGIPAYNDEGRAITEGSVYHVMYYGINNMGSYATQTTENELWQINHYVMILKDKLNGKPEPEFEQSSSTNEGQVVSSSEVSNTAMEGSENSDK
ncbi:MAG: cytochrome c [Leeuwenhoekiella sp.]